MTLDWALPATRWALFADLGIVFGVPMAAAVTGSHDALDRWRGMLVVAALSGIGIGVLGFLLVVANMAGLAPGQLDRTLVLPLLTGTAIGWALMMRSAALALCAVLAIARWHLRFALLIAAAGAAVATFAWSGHAAASAGAASWFRLGGDIVHLGGALTWVGALALFAGSLWRPLTKGANLTEQILRSLSNFAFAGSVIVALLVASGVANLLFLVPAAELPRLLRSVYGQLLLIKLALFLAMIGLAASNRFVLLPRLEQARHSAARLSAMATLKLSVSLELLAALAVLGLVAWLGTLDPLATGS